MAISASRTHLPLLAFVWALSVVCLGLSAHIIAKSNEFPVSQYHAVLIQCVFCWAWNSFFLLILIIGNAVAPRSVFFGAAVTFLLLFIGWLQSIVAAGSWTSIERTYGYLDLEKEKKALEGLQWVTTVFLLVDTVWAGLSYISNQATEVVPKKEEEVHF
ncbi:hypothetical protein BMF94_4561 [Rhodotorula taiwanensis]|uniref:MARVEL domain-containing protein n=1 Tax=Rhodotorula taiwanensis TaxID=741276 RepID=A0A2S5B6J4_9BASI|nr:hypothetical protein BMF94_4561 [Rhodotorula taiwanensis]